MNIIEHGEWARYTPVNPPKEAPASALYAQRSDGVDWYDYVRDEKTFAADSVKLAAMWRGEFNAYVVGPAVYDATMIFPAGHIVLEITDYAGGDPQAEFGNKVYSQTEKTFTDLPPPPTPPMIKTIEELMARVEKLEKK